MAEFSQEVRYTSDGVAIGGGYTMIGGSDAAANPSTGVVNQNFRYGNIIRFQGQVPVTIGTGDRATLINASNSTNLVKVPRGYKFYPTYVKLVNEGATAWTGGTNLLIQDTAASSVFATITITSTGLAANVIHSFPFSGSVTDVALGNTVWSSGAAGGCSYSSGIGQGLKITATGTFSGGTQLNVYVEGIMIKQ